jgi:hypothetical protein
MPIFKIPPVGNQNDFDVVDGPVSETINQSSKPNDNTTWFETPADHKNYLNDQSLNTSNAFYSTANESSQFKELDQSVNICELDSSSLAVNSAAQSVPVAQQAAVVKSSNNSTGDDFVVLKSCLISLMFTTQDFFVQQENFEEEIAKIQPLIDNCLEPFYINDSKYCVGQFKDDQLFYRMRVLDWNDEKNEVYALLIDYGNKTDVAIDTITKMELPLAKVKPLAINCCLDSAVTVLAGSQAYTEFENLVANEVRFNCRIRKSDLKRFYERHVEHGAQPCPIELF